MNFKVFLIGIFVLLLMGCKGPAEKAGEKLDAQVVEVRKEVEFLQQQIENYERVIQDTRRELESGKEQLAQSRQELEETRQSRQEILQQIKRAQQQEPAGAPSVSDTPENQPAEPN